MTSINRVLTDVSKTFVVTAEYLFTDVIGTGEFQTKLMKNFMDLQNKVII